LLAHFLQPFGKIRELFTAQLVIAIGIEAIKHAIRIKASPAFGAASSRATVSGSTTFRTTRPRWRAKTFAARATTTFTTAPVSRITWGAVGAFDLILQRRLTVELSALRWRAWPIAPLTRTAISRRASTSHEPTSGFGELRELFATQLTILVGIEFIEQSIGIRRRGATFRTTAFTASTTATAFAHGFTRGLAFLVVQLSIAVGVKLLDHLLTHFAVAARSVFFLSVRRGCWQEKNSRCQQQKYFAHVHISCDLFLLCYDFYVRSARPEIALGLARCASKSLSQNRGTPIPSPAATASDPPKGTV
jgi:hypothetical protein